MMLRTRIDVRDVSTTSRREWAVVDGETRREGKELFVVDLNGQNLTWVAIPGTGDLFGERSAPGGSAEDTLSIVLDRDGACSLAHALLSIIEDDN